MRTIQILFISIFVMIAGLTTEPLAQTVVFGDASNPTKATGIIDLQIGEIVYEVVFQLATESFNIYGPYPGTFNIFDTATEAEDAVDAVNLALNSWSAASIGNINQPGIEANSHNIGYESFLFGQLESIRVWRGGNEGGTDWLGLGQNQLLYNADARNWAVFSPSIIPVELTSFAASVTKDAVVLNWSTATELNNSGFEIERKSQGSFKTIGFVQGYGTTTEPHNYTYTDLQVEAATYYYRLKQVDIGGLYNYSDVVEVEVLAPDVYSLEQNYPNPFNPSTKIKFSLVTDSRVTLTVFDVLGQEVVTLINGNLSAGSHDIGFNADNLNSGVYFYRIDATGVDGTNFNSVKKMILTK